MIVKSKVVPIDSVRPNTWNMNEMRGSVYEFLKKSIKKRGFLEAITIMADGTIINGEHRWKALKELGESEVEVKVLDLTVEEAKAETVNFNLTKGTFDVGKLGELLLELDSSWGKDVLKENLVMEQKQIDAAIRAHQQTQKLPEDVPVIRESAVSTTVKSGDLYALGNHTLRCGDSTNLDDVLELISGNEIDMVLTDPPYNVGYKYTNHNDNMSEDDYDKFINQYVNVGLAVSPFVVTTPGAGNERHYYNSFGIIDTAYWYKGFSMTHAPVSRCRVTEPILFIGEKPTGKMLATDHLDYRTDREVGLLEAHSCPKPIGLWKELITTFTDTGGAVLDLFGGSGTTLIVAELTNRIAYVQENDPTYCQSIIDRFERQFGVKAEKI